MKILMWFLLSCKRQLRHGFFIMILLLMPVMLFAFSQIEKQDSGKIRIGVFSEDREIVPEIIDKLLEQDGMFQFYICDSQQMLKDDVAARRAECGYEFVDDFKEKLDRRKFKRSIRVYSAPSTIMADLSKEVVFASVIEVYGEDILEQFVEGNELFTAFDEIQIKEDLGQIYEKQRSGGGTFSFRYETWSTQPIEGSVARIAFPVRGMLAVYLMIIGVFSAVSLLKDEQRGLFIALPFGYGLPCKLAVLAAPVCLAGISALITLFVTANDRGIIKELTVLVIYLAMTVVFSYLLKMIVKDQVLLCGLIPVFILASLIICPVFIDISQWIPEAELFRYFLLPYYYMKMSF